MQKPLGCVQQVKIKDKDGQVPAPLPAGPTPSFESLRWRVGWEAPGTRSRHRTRQGHTWHGAGARADSVLHEANGFPSSREQVAQKK